MGGSSFGLRKLTQEMGRYLKIFVLCRYPIRLLVHDVGLPSQVDRHMSPPTLCQLKSRRSTISRTSPSDIKDIINVHATVPDINHKIRNFGKTNVFSYESVSQNTHAK